MSVGASRRGSKVPGLRLGYARVRRGTRATPLLEEDVHSRFSSQRPLGAMEAVYRDAGPGAQPLGGVEGPQAPVG